MAEAARYNIIAAFGDDILADTAVRRLMGAGVRRSDVRVVRPDDDGSPERRSEPPEKRGFAGTLAGLGAGVVLGAAVGLFWVAVTHSAPASIVRVVIAIVAFAAGGAACGFITGGMIRPRFDADPTERGTVVALHGAEADVVDRACKILAGSGAERVSVLLSG